MNINLNVPMPEFKNVTAEKLRKKLAEMRGENNESSNFSSTESEKKKDEKRTSQNEAGEKRDETKNQTSSNRWLKILLGALIFAVAIPIITWIWERIARLVRAARHVETAFA